MASPLAYSLITSLLVILAGCSGFQTIDNSPFDSAGTGADSLPPGVTNQGIEKPTDLAAANAETLLQNGYSFEYFVNVTIRRQGATQSQTFHQRETVSSNASSFLVFAEQSQPNQGASSTLWSNGSVTVARSDRTSQVQYRRPSTERVKPRLGARNLVRDFLGVGAYSINSIDDQPQPLLLTLSADEYVRQSNPQFPTPANVTKYSSTAELFSDGRVKSFQVTIIADRPDRSEMTIGVDYQLTQFGDVTIERPQWATEALDQTATN